MRRGTELVRSLTKSPFGRRMRTDSTGAQTTLERPALVATPALCLWISFRSVHSLCCASPPALLPALAMGHLSWSSSTPSLHHQCRHLQLISTASCAHARITMVQVGKTSRKCQNGLSTVPYLSSALHRVLARCDFQSWYLRCRAPGPSNTKRA